MHLKNREQVATNLAFTLFYLCIPFCCGIIFLGGATVGKELLTAQELAQKLDLSVETIWRYTREQKIPAIMVGTRQYRYDLEQVLKKFRGETTQGEMAGETKGEYNVGPHTYADYAALPEDPGYIVELIDGYFVKEPAPVVRHQRVSRRLQRILEDYFAQINPSGEVFDAPLDVKLSEYTTVQPDLIYVKDARGLDDAKWIDSTPELIVEILSPSSKRTDRIRKLDLYCRHGVNHYWIVDPKEGVIEVLKLVHGSYTIIAVTDGEFDHPDFAGLSFNMGSIAAKRT